jgi:hypothetical protein
MGPPMLQLLRSLLSFVLVVFLRIFTKDQFSSTVS